MSFRGFWGFVRVLGLKGLKLGFRGFWGSGVFGGFGFCRSFGFKVLGVGMA